VFYDGALRIVLNVRWPGRIEPGRVSDALVETVDAFPAILEAVGGEPSGRCMGRSLWPCVRDASAQVREAALSEVLDTSMVMTEQFKHACEAQGRGFMLYDRQADPDQTRNLVGAPCRLAAKKARAAGDGEHDLRPP